MSLKCAKTRSLKGLRVSVALSESQTTYATLNVGFQWLPMMGRQQSIALVEIGQMWWVSTFGQAVSPLRIVCSIVSTICCPNSSEVGGGTPGHTRAALRSLQEESKEQSYKRIKTIWRDSNADDWGQQIVGGGPERRRGSCHFLARGAAGCNFSLFEKNLIVLKR